MILFQSHLVSPPIIEEFAKIRVAGSGWGETVFLYHQKSENIPSSLGELDYYAFTDESLNALHYPMIGAKLVPGHAQFPLLQFFRERADYDYYWFVEYDVRFSGDWRFFFDTFAANQADFLTCNIRSYEEEPDWWWWALHHPRKAIPAFARLHSFNTVYRLSRSALDFLHQSLLSGWCGHHEVMMATVLYESGFRIEDIGGRGRFTPPGREGLFYTSSATNRRGLLKSGTMRFRPSFWKVGPEKNKLYHPVKPLSLIWRNKIDYLMAIDWPLIKRRFSSKRFP